MNSRIALLSLLVVIGVHAQLANGLPSSKNETDLKKKKYSALLNDVIVAMRTDNREKLLELMHPECRANGRPTKPIVKTSLDYMLALPVPPKSADISYQALELSRSLDEIKQVNNNRFFPDPEYRLVIFFESPPMQKSQGMSTILLMVSKEDGKIYPVAWDSTVVQMKIKQAQTKNSGPKQNQNRIPHYYLTGDLTNGKGILKVNGFPVARHDAYEGESYHVSNEVTPFLAKGENKITMHYYPAVKANANQYKALQVKLSKRSPTESDSRGLHSWEIGLEEHALTDLMGKRTTGNDDDNKPVPSSFTPRNKGLSLSQKLSRPLEGIPVLLKLKSAALRGVEQTDLEFVNTETGRKLVVKDAPLIAKDQQYLVPLVDSEAVQYRIQPTTTEKKNNLKPARTHIISSSGKEQGSMIQSDAKPTKLPEVNALLPRSYNRIRLRIRTDGGNTKVSVEKIGIYTCSAFQKTVEFTLEKTPQMPWYDGDRISKVTAEMRKSLKEKVERIHKVMKQKNVDILNRIMSKKAKAVAILKGISHEAALDKHKQHFKRLMDKKNWKLKPLPHEMFFEKINDRVIHVVSAGGNPVIQGKKPQGGSGGYLQMKVFFAKFKNKWYLVW